MRCGDFKQRIPWSRGLGHVGLGLRPRGETLDIDAVGLRPGFRPGGVDPRDVTETDRIEDRRSVRSMRTGFETPSRSVRGSATGIMERKLQ